MWFVPHMRNVHALLLYPMCSPPLQVGLGKLLSDPGPHSFPVVPMGLGEMGEHRATPGPGDNLQMSLQLLSAADRGFETSVCNPFFALLVSLCHCLGRWYRGKRVSQCETQGVCGSWRHQLSILCSSQAANKPLTGDMTGHGGFRERSVSSDQGAASEPQHGS